MYTHLAEYPLAEYLQMDHIIANNFATRQEHLEAAVTHATEYLNEIDKTLLGTNAAAHKRAADALALLAESEPLDITSNTSLEQIRLAYVYISKCENEMIFLQSILGDVSLTKQIFALRSPKFAADMQLHAANFSKHVAAFMSMDDTGVFEECFSATTPDELFKSATAIRDELDKFTIELLARAARATTGSQHSRVIGLIEAKKNQILGLADPHIRPKGVGPAAVISRHGLIAAGKCKPIDMWALKWKIDDVSQIFDKISNTTQRPVWVLDNSGLTPLETSPLPIMGDLPPPTSGLNAKIIETFNTSHKLVSTDQKAAMPAVYGRTYTTKPLIFETIDGGNTYRRLKSQRHTHLDGLSSRAAAYNSGVVLEFDPRMKMLQQNYEALPRAQINLEPFEQALSAWVISKYPSSLARFTRDERDYITDLVLGAMGETADILSDIARGERIAAELLKELDKALSLDVPPARWFAELKPGELREKLAAHHTEKVGEAIKALSRIDMWSIPPKSFKEYVDEHTN